MSSSSIAKRFEEWCKEVAPNILKPFELNTSLYGNCGDWALSQSSVSQAEFDDWKGAITKRYEDVGYVAGLAGSWRQLWQSQMNLVTKVIHGFEWAAAVYFVIVQLMIMVALYRLSQQGKGFSALNISLIANDALSALGVPIFDMDFLVTGYLTGESNIRCTPWVWPWWQRALFRFPTVAYIIIQTTERHLLLALALDRVQSIVEPVDYRVHDAFRRAVAVNIGSYAVNAAGQVYRLVTEGDIQGLPMKPTSNTTRTSQTSPEEARYPLPQNWPDAVCLRRNHLLFLSSSSGTTASSTGCEMMTGGSTTSSYYWGKNDPLCTAPKMAGNTSVIVMMIVLKLIPLIALIVTVGVLIYLLETRLNKSPAGSSSNRNHRVAPSSSQHGSHGSSTAPRPGGSSTVVVRSNARSSQTILLFYENVVLIFCTAAEILPLMLGMDNYGYYIVFAIAYEIRFVTGPFCVILISKNLREEFAKLPVVSTFAGFNPDSPMRPVPGFLLLILLAFSAVFISAFLLI